MQDNMTATAIALAFNQNNQRKAWTARANSRESLDRVHFVSDKGMVKLVYDTRTGIFHVHFNKVHGAWGDYIRAIARSLHVILTTLKSAGLPFDAPESDEGIVIRSTCADGGGVTVAYEPPVAGGIMRELIERPLGTSVSLSSTLAMVTPPALDTIMDVATDTPEK